MSWDKTVTLWCDGEDCYAHAETSDPTVSGTRADLTNWSYVDGKDFCPECSA